MRHDRRPTSAELRRGAACLAALRESDQEAPQLRIAVALVKATISFEVRSEGIGTEAALPAARRIQALPEELQIEVRYEHMEPRERH